MWRQGRCSHARAARCNKHPSVYNHQSLPPAQPRPSLDAHTGPNGRPEDKAAPGPIYTLTDDRPGADAVAAMGAALGAASVLFAKVDERYSLKLLGGAFTAYDVASRNQATYNAAVPNAAGAGGYRSATYLDDLSWCAAWLFIRSGHLKYRWSVKELYDKHMRLGGTERPLPVEFSESFSSCRT